MDIAVTVGDIDLTTVIGEIRVADEDGEFGEYESRKPVTLADEIVREATVRLTKTDAYTHLQERIRTARDEVIREHVESIVLDAIENPAQPTDMWGSPKGEPISLREAIVKEAADFLRRSTDSYGRQTTLQKMLAEAVAAAFKKELAETIAEEKAKVTAVVQAKAAALIAESVTAGVGGK